MQEIVNSRKPVRLIIILTIFFTLASPLFSFFLQHTFERDGPNVWLPLTLAGIEKRWFWQLLSSFFIQSPGYHITLSLLITLLLLMFLLWFTGKEIADHFGGFKFLTLYLSAGLFATLVGWAWLFLTHSSEIIYGSTAPIFALLIVLAMLYRDMQLHYFGMVRVKAKWLIAMLIAIPLLIELTHAEFALFLYNIAAVIWGYLFGRLVLKLPSLFKWKNKKIVNIASFQQESDGAFMDRMLDKIGRLGPGSLTEKERNRMENISRNRR